jgi:hypothetical protein
VKHQLGKRLQHEEEKDGQNNPESRGAEKKKKGADG